MAENREDLVLRFREESKDIRKALGVLIKRLEDAEGALDDTAKKAKSAGEKMTTAFTGATKKIERAFTGMAGKVTALLGVGGILGSFHRAIQGAKDFQASLAEVSTLIGGDARKQVAAYRGEITKLSKETGRSVTELSSGLYQVISAGTKGTESIEGSMKLLDVATKSAIGGISDTFSAVDLLTTSLNAYNKTTADAADFSDILFTTVKMGKVNFNQLATGMGMVASTAANAGVEFDELNAAFAELTKAGMLPARAFTGLQAVIRTLTQPTKELVALVKEQTGGTIEQALRTRGLIGVMEILNKKTKGNAFALKQYVKETEAANAVNILAGTGLEEFGRIMDQMKTRTGAAGEAYAKMADTFQQQSDKFWNKLELIFIQIGNKLLPVVTEKLEEMSKWLDKNSDKVVSFFVKAAKWIEKVVTFIIDWAPAAAKALGLVWAVGKIIEWNAALKKATAAVKAFAAANALGGLSGIIGGVKTAWKGLNVAMKANPFFVVIGAIAAVTNAVRILIDSWDELKDAIYGPTLKKAENEIMEKARMVEAAGVDAIPAVERVLSSPAVRTNYSQEKIEQVLSNVIKRIKLERIANAPDLPTAGLTAGFMEGAGLSDESIDESIAGKKGPSAVGGGPDKKWLAARKKELEQLHAIEMTARDELEQAYDAFAKKKTAVENLKHVSDEEKIEALNAIDEEWLKQKVAIEKKIEDAKASAQDKYLEDEMKAAKARRDLFKEINRVTDRAGDDYHQMREDAKKTADHIRENAAIYKREMSKAQANVLQQWVDDPEGMFFQEIGNKVGESILESTKEISPDVAEVLGDSIGSALEVVWEGLKSIGKAFLSMFEGLYQKAYDQLKELINKAFEAAAEGDKQLVLTDADRARMEEEMGRPLTANEARARATAYTPEQLSSLEQQGRIGDYEVVGTETPEDRMTEILATMQAWWENMAQNLGPILDWLTDVAGPALIDSIVENVPAIIDALNESWIKTLPKLAEEVLPMIISLISDELPGIIDALVTGIFEAMVKIGENIIPMALSLVRGVLALVTQLTTNMFIQLPLMLIKSTATAIKDVFTADFWKEIGREFFVALYEQIVDIFSKLWERIKDMFKSPAKKVGSTLKSGWDKFKNVFHEGGVVGERINGTHIINAVRAHNGAYVNESLAPNEVPIIAEAGERVLSRNEYGGMGGEQGVQSAINEGGGVGQAGDNVSVHIEHMMSEDTGAIVDRLLFKLSRLGASKTVGGRGVPGYKARRR